MHMYILCAINVNIHKFIIFIHSCKLKIKFLNKSFSSLFDKKSNELQIPIIQFDFGIISRVSKIFPYKK